MLTLRVAHTKNSGFPALQFRENTRLMEPVDWSLVPGNQT